MPEEKGSLWQTIGRLIGLLFENVDNKAVRAGLALGLILVLLGANFKTGVLLYVGLAFIVVAFVANVVIGFLQSRPLAVPDPESLGEAPLFRYARDVQSRAVALLTQGKGRAAEVLIRRALAKMNAAVAAYPDKAYYHDLRGYALKDLFQFTKNLLPEDERARYLAEAEAAFQAALRLDPQDPGAHNGLGNIRYFAGDLEGAKQQHEKALALKGGNYEAAEGDLRMVLGMLSLAQQGKIHPDLF
jgi:tetratricopeptide (TPR) repeat protein